MDYKKIIMQWKEYEIPDTLHRDISINLDSDFITAITGPRKAGKTYLCFRVIHNLLKSGTPKDNILYINFEDEKVIGADAGDLSKLLDTFYELTDLNKKQNIYLFLDEIQNVTNWDIWTRRIHGMHKNIKLILTGSSSKLLSKEISTKLRGLVINIEIFPLSFKEYIGWKKINYNLKTISHSKDRFDVKKTFNHYLSHGGYPALFTSKADDDTVLQSYFQLMILKDIIDRHKIKETKKLKILASLLFESTTKEISYNKLSNKFKSLGSNLSTNTIIEYISYFEDAYLFFQNLKYEYSLTKQLGSMKKIYCIDNGLLNSVSFKFSEDIGKLIENLVYIELKRRKKELYFHRKDYECDFLIKQKNKVVDAIQVTKELNDGNYNREINGLLEALETYKLKEGSIITLDTEDNKRIRNKTIRILPAWKWLLENQ